MRITLHVWRQKNAAHRGGFESHTLDDILEDMSFLEMLDQLNERLAIAGHDPVAYEFDCREGICGTCSLVINGQAHGPSHATTTCQTYMRSFKDGDEIFIEPFRAKAFPVIKDLVVDRSALDRIQQAGGYVSVNTGNAPDGNAVPIPSTDAAKALDAAACIGCGACVAACPNASASLFVAAKVAHLASLPQGAVERGERVGRMVAAMDEEKFGSCTNHGECEAVCPMEIGAALIAGLNRELIRKAIKST